MISKCLKYPVHCNNTKLQILSLMKAFLLLFSLPFTFSTQLSLDHPGFLRGYSRGRRGLRSGQEKVLRAQLAGRRSFSVTSGWDRFPMLILFQ